MERVFCVQRILDVFKTEISNRKSPITQLLFWFYVKNAQIKMEKKMI